MKASEKGHAEVVEKLLRHNARTDAQCLVSAMLDRRNSSP